MYMFPPHGERKGNIYSLKSVCFYEKQTPLQYLHVLWFFFFLSSFLSCRTEGWFVLKGFHCNKNYLTHVPVWKGTREQKSSGLKLKIKVKLWTAMAIWENRDATQGAKYVLLSAAHLCIPSTRLHCKQVGSRTLVCNQLIHFSGRDVLFGANISTLK